MYLLRHLTFTQIREEVVSAIRHRIAGGEFTERGLARLAGVSQPHLHNILKGIRELTPAVGDALLAAMDMGLLDFVEREQLGRALASREGRESPRQVIPVLRGRISPGWPVPDCRQHNGWRPLPPDLPVVAGRPALALLAPDPALTSVFPGARAAVLDSDEMARLRPEVPAWYLVRHPRGGLIRQVRLRSGQLQILGQAAFSDGNFQRDLPLGSSSLLHLVRARVLWVGSSLDWPLACQDESPGA